MNMEPLMELINELRDSNYERYKEAMLSLFFHEELAYRRGFQWGFGVGIGHDDISPARMPTWEEVKKWKDEIVTKDNPDIDKSPPGLND